MHKPDEKKFVLTVAIATLVTMTLTVLGAPFLRVIHNVFGSKRYWGAGIVVALALLPAGPVFSPMIFGFWFVVGLYGEFEARGKAGFWTALAAVLFGSAISLGGPWLWARALGLDIVTLFADSITLLQNNLLALNVTTTKIDGDAIIAVLPATVIVMNITMLGFALMMDRRIGLMLGLRFERVASEIKLLDFKLPDSMIWVMMISFLFSFISLNNSMITTVAWNVFICTMAAYFFQGLAVFEVLMLVLQVGRFSKALIYLLVVANFFPLLSGVGIMDFWLDFRKRMKKWRQKKLGHKNGEQV